MEGQLKTKTESEFQEERSENLDDRLNRMMLQEDLPLFLQEFEEEWQDARLKFGQSNKNEKERRNESTERLKKEVKRLKKCEFKIDKFALKDLGRRIINRIKDQIKENIMEHLLTEQVETWFLNEKKILDSMQTDKE